MFHRVVRRLLIMVGICVLWCGHATAQKVLVYSVVGEVTQTAGGKQMPLPMNATIDYNTEINIPYGGKVELVDEARSKRIILKKPGRATVKAHAKSASNSVLDISARYLTYVKKQMTNTGLVSRQRYTDYATVTREIDSIPSAGEADANAAPNGSGKGVSLRAKFDMFKSRTRQKHLSFREECNRKYIEFVRKAWNKYNRHPAVGRPVEPRVEPRYVPETEPVDALPLKEEQQRKVREEVLQPKSGEMPPVPIQPVAPINEVEEDEEFAAMPFTFCGTELTVRLDETKRINLADVTPDKVADALQYFSTDAYNNLLIDCLKIRDEHKLCDWAYLLMLKALADQYSGPSTNEGTLLLGYLYYQSGYKVRFATNNERIYLLVASDHIIYDNGAYVIGGEMFYPLEETEATLSICEAAFPKERTLSLYIPNQPLLDEGETETRRIASKRYPDITTEVSVNKNLIDFYDTYPSSCINDDFTTRWVMYANTPVAKDVRDKLYAPLKEKLAGMSRPDAVNRLLNFVQTGFAYEYDDNVWGGDRVFFAEETLYYPFCDCEDRSILFTRLVRDILNMECVLVYYPGHLAAAVCFDEQPGGVFYTSANGKNYTLCDPTYIGAGVGMEMPGLDTSDVKLIHIAN